jgi:hypothetical protein
MFFCSESPVKSPVKSNFEVKFSLIIPFKCFSRYNVILRQKEERMSYVLNQDVEALWLGVWYDARIIHVPPTETVYWYKVKFADDVDACLKTSMIRLPTPTFSQQCAKDCDGLRSNANDVSRRATRSRDPTVVVDSPNERPRSKSRINVSSTLFKSIIPKCRMKKLRTLHLRSSARSSAATPSLTTTSAWPMRTSRTSKIALKKRRRLLLPGAKLCRRSEMALQQMTLSTLRFLKVGLYARKLAVRSLFSPPLIFGERRRG